MKAALWLGWRSLRYHKLRSLLLLGAATLVALLPLLVERLFRAVEDAAIARSEATPIVVGRAGSRFDLVLGALWFRGRTPEALPLAEIERVRKDGLAEPVPILARNTAAGWPLVGTSPQYYRVRGLTFSAGGMPLELGECVVGADIAARGGAGLGDSILTDRRNPLAIDEGYPLRMRIVGVLARVGTADDSAVFASLETVWIAEGIGHGHVPAEQQASNRVMRTEGDRIVLNSGVVQYQEVTAANRDSFHFHVDRDDLPLTAILAFPRDVRAATILKARYRVVEDRQALVPREIVTELTGYVLGLKRFLDIEVLLVGCATALLLGLVVTLTVRLRGGEIRTLVRIGAPRSVVFGCFAVEFGVVLGLGVLAAFALAWAGVAVLRSLLPWF